MGKRIILGSGHLYRTAFTSGMTIADPQTYCIEANRFSHIKNGATLEYTQEKTIEEDDMGLVRKTRLNTDKATFKGGLMTLEAASLQYLTATSSAPESIAAGTGTVAKNKTKIGGVNNENETPYLWVFHHPDRVDGDIWLVLAGTNNANLNIEFKKDGANVSDFEVDALPLDNEGRKVYYYEPISTEFIF